MANWYQRTLDDTVAALTSDAVRGLSDAEIEARLAQHGPNELVERGGKNPWVILFEQFTNTLVLVLIVAAVASAFLGDYEDAVAIMAIVILNAALGFRQEYKAERAMAALKKLATPTVRVRRDGRVHEVSARQLVPGDVVLLEAGNLVPADGRLLTSANLRVQEATLTGESEPVEKDARALYSTDLPIGDQLNMVFMGTSATYGHGEVIITETGMQTQLGRIADLLQATHQEDTPLQKRLDRLGKVLALVALAIVAVIFGMGILRGDDWELMFLTAVSMAVAAVPEGLPAVVTIALSMGAQRMLKRNALIRKLPAVETLGSVTVICSDKTGTLTQNRMTVTVLEAAGHRLDLAQEIAQAHGARQAAGALGQSPAFSLLLAGGTLCNDVILETAGKPDGNHRVIGDPTEAALAVAAAQMELVKGELEQTFPRVAEEPFDSTRKRMTTVHRLPAAGAWPEDVDVLAQAGWQADNADFVALTKGANDGLLQISSHVWVDGAARPLTDDYRQRITGAHDELAKNGMRILGMGYRLLGELPEIDPNHSIEGDLTYVGLIAMIDPPRPEVRDAVTTCKTAGIRPIMITGDHPLTARHIAGELGIATDSGLITGQDLDSIDERQLADAVTKVSVYARVSPEHKLNIVQALQDHGQIVAMTGDGVNDAPALKRADIGVAMGITGTDVAKEAAEMVLQDDNFATIVAAVEEGRVIYDNIRKFIRYLLTCNSGEIWVMLIGPLLGMPLPLLPLQILWMNLVTDGLPALALSTEPAEPNTMQRPPYPPGESIFSRGVGQSIIWVGLVMALAPLALAYFYWSVGNPEWQTVGFTALVMSQMALALAVRSERESLWKIGIFSNRSMVGAILLTLVLQLGVIYLPFAQELFGTVPLVLRDLIICLILSTLPLWWVEGEKWWMRRRAERKG